MKATLQSWHCICDVTGIVGNDGVDAVDDDDEVIGVVKGDVVGAVWKAGVADADAADFPSIKNHARLVTLVSSQFTGLNLSAPFQRCVEIHRQ